jgi:ATP-dependent DNA helicase RecG
VSARNKLFREVVANLLIHREYSNAYPAKLIIERGRVITENGNKARGMGNINLTEFVPYPKNPIIASVFKEIGWAEELGSGVRNITKYCKIFSDEQPKFIDGDVFKTIIGVKTTPDADTDGTVNDTNETDFGTNDETDDTDSGVNGGTDNGAENAVSDTETLIDCERAVLNLIVEDNTISIISIIKKLDVSRSTVNRILKSLKEKGYIKRNGTTKSGNWEVLKR